MTILEDIVAHKKSEVSRKKARRSKFELAGLAPTRDFERALRAESVSLIAEIKRRSPSKDVVREDADPAHIAGVYERNGASAVSVLTDEKFFGGHDECVALVKGVTDLPVLRKEFVIDPFQIYESRALGADAILLIASILTEEQISSFLSLAYELDLSCLVEAHTEEEVKKALRTQSRIIGINNRNLATLDVDVTTSYRLRKLIPPERVTVSESGIQTREEIVMLAEAGFDAVLIGESLMNSPDIANTMRELLGR